MKAVHLKQAPAESLEALAEQALTFFDIRGLYVVMHDIKTDRIDLVHNILNADTTILFRALEKIRDFKKKANGTNISPQLKGVLRLQEKIWAVANNQPEINEALVIFLALKMTADPDPRELENLLEVAHNNSYFTKLNGFFKSQDG